MGATYGSFSRFVPAPAPVKGIIFALLVWAGSYLGWLPAFDVSGSAPDQPLRRNVLMIGAHVVWGAVAGPIAAQFEHAPERIGGAARPHRAASAADVTSRTAPTTHVGSRRASPSPWRSRAELREATDVALRPGQPDAIRHASGVVDHGPRREPQWPAAPSSAARCGRCEHAAAEHSALWANPASLETLYGAMQVREVELRGQPHPFWTFVLLPPRWYETCVRCTTACVLPRRGHPTEGAFMSDPAMTPERSMDDHLTIADRLDGLKYRNIGPHRGGRVVAVAGHPRDPMVFYFGACAGGIWKTVDGGTFWECVSDGFPQYRRGRRHCRRRVGSQCAVRRHRRDHHPWRRVAR